MGDLDGNGRSEVERQGDPVQDHPLRRNDLAQVLHGEYELVGQGCLPSLCGAFYPPAGALYPPAGAFYPPAGALYPSARGTLGVSGPPCPAAG